jgi:phosphoserine phosphatase
MQAMLRVSFRLGASLGQAYIHTNNQLSEDLPDDRFITAFFGFLDPATHEVNYHSGGQGPILHFRAVDESCDWHSPTNFPVGIMEIAHEPESVSLKLQAGDILALISDGVYEYANPDGEIFGEQRVAEVFKSCHQLPMSDLTAKLIEAVTEFGGDAAQADDITLVLVRRLPD